MGRRYVLVGSGPAAIAACEAIRGDDQAGSIVVATDDPHGYYSRPGLAYYLAGDIPERRLFPFATADLARLGAHHLSVPVAGLDPAAREVAFADGRTAEYDRLLLATGSQAIIPSTPGVELRGVVKLDDLDDARRLLAAGREAKTAVVVGGGITAVEIAEALLACKVKVHYFLRKERYWSNVLSEVESRLVEMRLRAHGLQLHHFTELAAIHGRGGRVAAVETKEGAQIGCQLVALAVGVLPRKRLAEAAGLDCGRGVLVDETLRTSDEHVFAAGDLAETPDRGTGRRTLEVLWNAAVAKGRVAGLNMAAPADAPRMVYRKGLSLNVTRLAGYHVTIVGRVGRGEDADLKGLARGDSDTWASMDEGTVVEHDSGESHLRLVVGAHSLVGAVVMGAQDMSFVVQELVGSGAELGDLRPQLLEPGAPLPELLERAWRRGKAGRV